MAAESYKFIEEAEAILSGCKPALDPASKYHWAIQVFVRLICICLEAILVDRQDKDAMVQLDRICQMRLKPRGLRVIRS